MCTNSVSGLLLLTAYLFAIIVRDSGLYTLLSFIFLDSIVTFLSLDQSELTSSTTVHIGSFSLLSCVMSLLG